jgi:hypothetical protein
LEKSVGDEWTGMSSHRAAFLVWALLLGGVWCHAAYGTAGDAATTTLPFRPLGGPHDRFSASNLTVTYEKDPTLFLNGSRPPIDLAQLDRYGHFPYGDVPLDPNEKSLVGSPRPQSVADVSPQEKDELTPPTAGAHVGIPSAVAATGALLGGLAILVKILTLGI